jgi:hypothetical protein
MRLLIVLAATAALSLPALAQQPRPPARAPAAPPPAAQAPAAPAGMFPCRSEAEVCHVGVPTSANQVMILFSSSPQGQASEGRTVSVQGADLAQSVGKVVMLTGELGASGINGAQVVDTAGPLLSLAIKLQLGGGGDDGGPAAAPPKGPAPKGGPAPRR